MGNKLWTCRDCGDTVRAPERMRKDNALRFCLPCSGKTGKMVERWCPSAERMREERSAARREAKVQANTRRAIEAARREVEGRDRAVDERASVGVDLPRLFQRCQAADERARGVRWSDNTRSLNVTYAPGRDAAWLLVLAATWATGANPNDTRAAREMIESLWGARLPLSARSQWRFDPGPLRAAVLRVHPAHRALAVALATLRPDETAPPLTARARPWGEYLDAVPHACARDSEHGPTVLEAMAAAKLTAVDEVWPELVVPPLSFVGWMRAQERAKDGAA